MKKRAVFFAVFWLFFSAGVAFSAYHHEGEADSDNVSAVYPEMIGTKLDSCALCHTGGRYEKKPGVMVSMGSCQWCHYTYGYDQSGDISETLNPYGNDYLANGRDEQALTAIETLDSDGDTYSNKTEIDAVRYPGNADDDPTKKTAPFRVYTRAQLESLPQHSQFFLMNTNKSGDFYAEYKGPAVETLLWDAGILGSAAGLTVYAPDAWSQYHPLEENPEPEMYHVLGTYPEATYQYNEQADRAVSPDVGWCSYSAPSNSGRNHEDVIEVEGGLKMVLATKRDGENLTAGTLTTDNKLDGEGPYRVVVPQKTLSPPDQASNADNQEVIWPYNEDWDHNAGACTRSVTILRVDPLPEGTTDIDILEAGWDYIDQEKVIVYGAIAGKADESDKPELTEVQTVDTAGARSWHSFTIDDVNYLAAANETGASEIYKWNGSAFESIQTIDILWGEKWESFVMNGETYLGLALNRKEKQDRIAESPIFKWNGSAFEQVMTITTLGARDFKSFVIDGETYLAVANERDNSTRNVNSVIYKWEGEAFAEFQAIPTHSARDWEYFEIDGTPFLAIANQDNDETRDIESEIYRWDGSAFVKLQSILTQSARDWESFTIDGSTFLAVANNQSSDSRAADSVIYRWNGTAFEKFQSFLTYGAHDWESFKLNGVPHLAVANIKNDTTAEIDSKIYKWNGSAFVEVLAVPTFAARDWESFVIDGAVYLAVANDDGEFDENIFSSIYKFPSEDSGDDGGSSSCFLSSLLN